MAAVCAWWVPLCSLTNTTFRLIPLLNFDELKGFRYKEVLDPMFDTSDYFLSPRLKKYRVEKKTFSNERVKMETNAYIDSAEPSTDTTNILLRQGNKFISVIVRPFSSSCIDTYVYRSYAQVD